jgi:hypothetical protein
VRVAIDPHELDFDRLDAIHLDHGSHVADPQTRLGMIDRSTTEPNVLNAIVALQYRR